MRISRAAARTKRDRGDAEGDRDVGVGGSAGEFVFVAHRARRSDRGLHERVRARRESRRTITDAPELSIGGGGSVTMMS